MTDSSFMDQEWKAQLIEMGLLTECSRPTQQAWLLAGFETEAQTCAGAADAAAKTTTEAAAEAGFAAGIALGSTAAGIGFSAAGGQAAQMISGAKHELVQEIRGLEMRTGELFRTSLTQLEAKLESVEQTLKGNGDGMYDELRSKLTEVIDLVNAQRVQAAAIETSVDTLRRAGTGTGTGIGKENRLPRAQPVWRP